MKVLLAVLVLSLGSCTFLEDILYEPDEIDTISVPVTMAAEIATRFADILLSADLDEDGEVSGYEEWLQLVIGIWDAVQDLTDESTLDN